MKKLSLVVCLLVLFLESTNANAWFFFFLPGSVASKITDSITGDEGENCVTPSAKIGDKVRLSSGETGTIKSLSGNSSRCTNALPVRALITPDVQNHKVIANQPPATTNPPTDGTTSNTFDLDMSLASAIQLGVMTHDAANTYVNAVREGTVSRAALADGLAAEYGIGGTKVPFAPPPPTERLTPETTKTEISISQKLRELQSLRKDEIITEEEFQNKKKQLLEEL